jgi:ribonuclease-3
MPYSDFENTIGYFFRNKKFIKKALVHPSADKKARDFERLEFLGDRVLGLVIAQWLYEYFPSDDEGDLAKRLTALVRKDACEQVAKELQMEKIVKVSKTDIKGYTAVYADAVEALMGAMFLDGGISPCYIFIKRFWSPIFNLYKFPPKDPKTELQEWAQFVGKPIPSYILVRKTGPAHSPYFYIHVEVLGFEPQLGEGDTKRIAERDAASNFLKIFNPQKDSR